MHWEWAVWRMHGQPWQVSYRDARRAQSAHDYGPGQRAAASTVRTRRTGSRRKRMEQRWLLGGLRSGALEEGARLGTLAHFR
jgi:hypothetical protein